MHLIFWMITAHESGATEHPQKEIINLGITYQHATPQSIGEQWWFWNCENIPKGLPEYLSELDIDPMNCIGFGLYEKEAIKIRDYKKGTSLQELEDEVM